MNDREAPEASYHETRTEVRYAETDQMGYAHHACAVAWFELGRVAWMRELGCPYRELEARGILMPVVRLDLRYVAPGRFEDNLVIGTRLLELRRARVVFENRVEREASDGARELLVQGAVELACVDREGRIQRLPGDVRARFESRLPGGAGPVRP
ncbi:MAG: acyl-CoA thioesterase [Planctomycetota bacterium]|nr:acyl-CoA thioesterase [Planctomycetota bacterium]